MPSLSVDDTSFGRLAHGQSAELTVDELAPDALARLYHAETFIGLGVVKGPQEVAPKRLLSTVARS